MARRTKEVSNDTRYQILDAAEKLFAQNGVYRTSLQAIAIQAGVTRGAIYWHFRDKADIFSALIERVDWPIDQEALSHLASRINISAIHPLVALKKVLIETVEIISRDVHVHRLLDICYFKIEHAEDMGLIRARIVEGHEALYQRILAAFLDCQVTGLLPDLCSPHIIARTMQSNFIGLVYVWLLNPQSFDLPSAAKDVIEVLFKASGLHDFCS